MNFEQFTIKAQEAMQSAVKRAVGDGHYNLTPLHLLIGVLEVGENVTHFILQKLAVNEQALRASIEKQYATLSKGNTGGKIYYDQESETVLKEAERMAHEEGDTYVGLEMLLCAILKYGGMAGRLMKDAGIDEKSLKMAINELRGGKK
ncbi:MAG: Clp protease N-terminal domain-containing protein, partial [Alloprevotella sp.]